MIPHLSLPFRLVGAAAAVSEQGSDDEIRDCVAAVVRCPQGFRVELPEFGAPDQTFVQQGADPAVLAAAIRRWEPRADLLVAGSTDPDDLTVSRLAVEVGRSAG